MDIFELSYVTTVLCYRNTDALEERHAAENNMADKELYDVVYSEVKRKLEIAEKVLPSLEAGKIDEALTCSEKEFCLMAFLISKGYRQWDPPVFRDEQQDDDIVEYILYDVKKFCMRHENLTQDVMKRLNRGVHDRVYSLMVSALK